jgi:hypothetical protein
MALIGQKTTPTLFNNNSSEFDVVSIGYQINNFTIGYLYLKSQPSIHTEL